MKIEKKKRADAERYKKKEKLSQAAALEYKKKKAEYDANRYQKMKAKYDPSSLLHSKPRCDPSCPTITESSTAEEIAVLEHKKKKKAEYDAKRYQKMKAKFDRVSFADFGKRVYSRRSGLVGSKPQYDLIESTRPTINDSSTPEEIRNALSGRMSDAEIDDIGRRFNCNGVKRSYLSFFPELKQLDKISDYSTKDEVCSALLNYVNGGRSNPMYSDETRARLDNYIAVLIESNLEELISIMTGTSCDPL